MTPFQNSFKSICLPTVLSTVKRVLFRLSSTEARAVQRTMFRHPNERKNVINFAGYALLIMPISAFGLGTWQVFRKMEKEKIIEVFMEKVKQPPVDLPQNLEELQDMEFRAVRVKGRFLHDKELYLGPRTEVSDDPISRVSTLLSRSKGGFMVITPFELSDRKLTILVNRGWVPANKKSPLSRKEGQITEEVELIGLVRLHEERQPLGLKNIPEKGCWVYRDLYKMAAMTGTAPVLIDADKASTVPGGPIGGQTIVEIRNVHLSYIFTWYGLCILSSWAWYKRYMYKKPYGLQYITKSY